MISVQQPRIALNLFPGEMLDEMRHEEVLVAAWKYSLWAQEVRNLIFKKAATCSHLPVAASGASGCKWLLGQVAACGCLWLQMAASGCKWPLGQVASRGCKWLLVAASGCLGKWLQVAASGCKWLRGCLSEQLFSIEVSKLEKAMVCICHFFSSCQVPRNDGILRDNS